MSARARRRRDHSKIDAKTLALRLADTIKRSDAEVLIVVSALSVLLGATIGSGGESSELMDFALTNIRRALVNADDDRARALQ